jgi:Zn-dependent protease
MAQTPPKDLFMAIFYWLLVYYISLLPVLIKQYEVRLVLLTLIVPNVMRMVVNRMPRLAVDRSFFFTATAMALILTYVLHSAFKKTREDMDEFGKDVKKTLEVSGLLTATFTAGALATYYIGLDRSIYSNLNWE